MPEDKDKICQVNPQADEYWWAEITENEIEPVYVYYNRPSAKELCCDVMGWDAGIDFKSIIRWIEKIERPIKNGK